MISKTSNTICEKDARCRYQFGDGGRYTVLLDLFITESHQLNRTSCWPARDMTAMLYVAKDGRTRTVRIIQFHDLH